MPVPTTEAPTEKPTATEVPTEQPTEEPMATEVSTEPEATDTATPTPTEGSEATPEASGGSLFSAPRAWLGSIIVSLGEPLLAVGEIPLAQEALPTPTEAPTPTVTSTEMPTEAPAEEPMPTVTSTAVPTEAPTEEATATETPTEVPTQEVTSTPVESPTARPETASPTPTASATATPTASPTMAFSPTATITVTARLTATATPTITPTVTITPTATTTLTPTVIPTVTITPTATVTPTQPSIVLQQLHTSGITNTATIDSDQTEPRSDEEHNPFPPGIELVDPVIGKSATPPYAHPGQEVTFTLTVRNQGIAQAQNVWVTDTVPAFLDAFAATTTKGTVQPIVNNTVVVYIGTLEPHGAEVVTITIRTRVRSGTPAGTLMNNLAVVTADGGDDQDDAPVRVPRDGGDDDDGPPPPAPTPTPAPTALVTPTPTPEILTVAILPETGGHPGLLSALVGLSIMTGFASLLLLALSRREGKHSDDEEG